MYCIRGKADRSWGHCACVSGYTESKEKEYINETVYANILFRFPSPFIYIYFRPICCVLCNDPDSSMNPFNRLWWLDVYASAGLYAPPFSSFSPQQRICTDTHTHTCRKYWFKQHYTPIYIADCKCPMENMRSRISGDGNQK